MCNMMCVNSPVKLADKTKQCKYSSVPNVGSLRFCIHRYLQHVSCKPTLTPAIEHSNIII